MKYQLLEDHKIRNTDVILKAGIYSLQELRDYHIQDSLEYCIKYTKLGVKLIPFIEKEEVKTSEKQNKGKKNV